MHFAAVKRRMAKRIYKNTITTRRYVERHRSMRISRINFRVRVDPNCALLVPLLKGHQLQTEAIHQLVRGKLKLKLHSARGNGTPGNCKRHVAHVRKLLQSIEVRRNSPGAYGRVRLRNSNGALPYSRRNHTPL